MHESILFKNIDLVLPTGIFQGDVLVEEGKIKQYGPSISKGADLIINESGLTLLPGGIDPHVHFRDPGATHKESIASGSRAAAAGGMTSFFDMPNTKPSTTTCETLMQKKKLASETSLINYNFFIGATSENCNDLKQVSNVPGIKIYVGSSTGSLLVDQADALHTIFSQTDKLIAVHSEDEAMIQEKQQEYQGSTSVWDHEKIRSAEGALVCTKRLVELALKTNTRLHICHLTTKQEVAYLEQVDNALITTEVTPQHLFLYGPDIYEKWQTFAQINPPIRDITHQQALFQGLTQGIIHCVGSDHAPHTKEEKNKPFGQAPSGMPGVETSLPVLLNAANNGLFSLQDVVRWVSEAPAQVFNILYKGAIKEDYDADLVLVDLAKKKTITSDTVVSKCGWNIFEGETLQGWPIATFVNGQMVYREGDFFEETKGKEVLIKE